MNMSSRLTRRFLAGAVIVSSLLAACPTRAQLTTILNSVDRGWYDESGFHSPTNANYLAGIWAETTHRNFFVFDRSAVFGTVTAAELRIFLPNSGFASPSSSENFFIYKVDSTPLANLTSGGFGLTSIYSDLGGGTSFGNAMIEDTDENSTVSISLNAAFVTYVNSLTGSFALGGRVTTLSGTADQAVFAFSAFSDPRDGQTQLVLHTRAPEPSAVPEPAAYAVCGAGLLAVVALRRSRKNAR